MKPWRRPRTTQGCASSSPFDGSASQERTIPYVESPSLDSYRILNLFRGVFNADKIQIGLDGQSFFVVYKLIRKVDGKPVPL
jgi:hypothetical protein